MSVVERPLQGFVHWLNVNRRMQWHQLPWPVEVPAPLQLTSLAFQLANLALLRDELRKYNLYDSPRALPDVDPVSDPPPEAIRARQPDGRWNDLSDPLMGSMGSPFGRNVPPSMTVPDTKRMLDPNPRDISNKLLARDVFKPAHIINTLAAAWLQFENHNWFFHGRGDPEDTIEIPLRPDDDWPENPMHIRRTPVPAAQPKPHDRAPSYANYETHWWDATQIYGSGAQRQAELRTFTDGKLKVQGGTRLSTRPDVPGVDLTGMHENWWTGIALFHTLFTLEHNAICDALKKEYPRFDDQRLYELAWLVNSAVIAKIHTVEWTTTVLRHPGLQAAMNANWWGAAGEAVKRRIGRLGSGEVISGIIGSQTDHHGVPFSLTEEFVSVYRMHPLIPDDWTFFSMDDDRLLEERTFTEIQGRDTREFMDRIGLRDLWYSFGLASAGRVCLHNYPNSLRRFTRIDGELNDLASLDILRDRERGVPRYNDFREALRMPRIRSFKELTPNRAWAAEIAELYHGNIDLVDPMVGMYSEAPPLGYGFSDTAFRVFILMASRRLKSDRFFTTYFTPDVYTKLGYDWVQKTTLKDVLLRHHPDLAPALESVELPFAPWPQVSRDGSRNGAHRIADRAVAATKALRVLAKIQDMPLDDTGTIEEFHQAPQPKFDQPKLP